MRVAFCTLGCKVNQYETESMREAFAAAGHTPVAFRDLADAYIVNSCAVTGMSARKTRQMISRAHSRCPNAVVAVVGCYAQTSPDEVYALPGVAVVIGSQKKKEIVLLVESAVAERKGVVSAVNGEISREYEEMSAVCGENTRAYVKIQDGCDSFCSYCIIPYARGRKRSRRLEDVVSELRELEARGYHEVVLTGIHLLSYGDDLEDGIDLRNVLKAVDTLDGIRRVRLGSLDAARLSDGLIEAIAASPKVCRQFHLSLQSGSDTVLKRMNRRYTAAEYADTVCKLRAALPGCAITTDIISGFPQETDAEHAETMAFAAKIGFSKIHVFPYSRRDGTVAARMDGQIPPTVRDRRAHELLELTEKLERDFAEQLVGSTVDVLIEEPYTDGGMTGFTDTYVRVFAENCAALPGDIVSVRVTGLCEQGVAGREVLK